ncbi:MAG TPA: threonylcarbamoyl-AMP synthase [Bacteroidetes bacterium]|nr:threonylcarbamoyl-AMP synthase [Bacteroidota bacterium]
MANHFDLEPIITCLKNGGTILFPTDTIWGIGCDATRIEAVEKVFEIKKRDRHKPFVLLVSSVDMLKEYVEQVHPRVETLLAFHQRPLTIIYPKAKNLAPNACAADGSVAIRIVTDPFCQQLIASFAKPLVATSANIAGTPAPAHFGEISSSIIVGVNYVVKHRQMDKNMDQPSVIARIQPNGELEFIR